VTDRPAPDDAAAVADAAAAADAAADADAARTDTLPVAWGPDGLAPVVVQAADPPGGVLMLAWANEAALRATLDTGLAHFWSRARAALWRKGETSGNVQRVEAVLIDCDADALVYVARPAGPACHTGAPSCFFRRLTHPAGGTFALAGTPEHPAAGRAPADPGVLAALQAVVAARRALPEDSDEGRRSYVRGLFADGAGGVRAAGDKIAEEAAELVRALRAEDRAAVVHEAADVLFHLLVGLAARDVTLDDVLAELARRHGVGGLAEKAARGAAQGAGRPPAEGGNDPP
jgi:phosphoribosyl-ATP pyrophosphohydrolase/phosphoribosyl-AMP cyclohydrolase